MPEKIQDFFLSSKECILESPTNFYGSFCLGPLKNSQSLTVANALRRTLLSEIQNIAITHLEIEGALHEYATLIGVRESTLDLLLNFKQIVLKTGSPLKKPLYGYLNVRGPGIVRASDLRLPPMIQCVDPDQYLATLNENGKLVLKFTISDFRNLQKNDETSQYSFYQTQYKELEKVQKSTKNKNKRLIRENFPLNSTLSENTFSNFALKDETTSFESFNTKRNRLWVDPIFSPILKVNYSIETIEPFQKNIPNQIIFLELWTNGSLHPRKALYEALCYLKIMFEKLDSMRFLNSQFMNITLESSETSEKFLQMFEYDYHFYNFIENKKARNFSSKKLFFSQEIKEIQNDYTFAFEKKNDEVWSNVPISKLNLPYRVTKILEKNNIFFLEDLFKISTTELKNFPGIGTFSLSILQKRLGELGFQLTSEKI